MAKGEAFIGNFLFFVTVLIFSFWSTSFKILLVSAIFVIALSIAFKFFITQKLLLSSLDNSITHVTTKIASDYLAVILAFVLIVCSVINIPGLEFTKYFIVGQFPPNVWHNSTTIFLMPFAILLFYKSYELINEYSSKKALIVCLLILLNALAKPSFILCFAVAYPIVLFENYLLSKQFWIRITPLIFTFFILAAQYVVNFYFSKQMNIPDEGGIKIAPFNVWNKLSDNWAVSLLLSTVYPLVFLLFYFRNAFRDALYKYAFVLFIVATLIMIFLSETGAREFHGNFLWQGIICNFILFLATCMTHLKIIGSNQKLGTKDKLIFSVLFIHFLTGILYLIKFTVLKNYH
jgi:hypothetical protein